MPQMMPMNWLELYMYFSSLFMLMITMNFFMLMYKPKSKNYNKIKIFMNWKW
uniref:ATP synthase F0 subunit 8 n=1 Tax=Mecinus janthinus TaxID=1071889 RepID=A0A343C4X7_9CUCU|nr:ATP synthase F0 subunit 8 [Mecinus janthinus]